MAHKLRSLISNKIVQTLEGIPIGGRGLKPSTVLPCIQIDPRCAGLPEFTVSLKALHNRGILNNLDQPKKQLSSIGSEIVERLDTDSSIPAVYLNHNNRKTGVALNFKVDYSQLASEVISITNNKPESFWLRSGLVNLVPYERVILDYSSPNIAKPFHVGHLRSTIIGSFLARLHKALGHHVTSINYLGDWGTQFGLLRYGYDALNLTESSLEDDAIKKLYKVYVWANEQAGKDPTVLEKARHTFSQMEEGDEEALEKWRLFRRVSVEDLKRVYAMLNVEFDEYHGESMYGVQKCREVIDAMETKGLLKTLKDGRKVFVAGPDRSITVVKSDGTTLYLSRDIAGAIDRYERYKFTRSYYVVGNEQSDHFTYLFSILEALGYSWVDGMKHIKFSRIEGMSSRKGEAIFLQDLVDEAKNVIKNNQNQTKSTKINVNIDGGDVAEKVAVSSIIIESLKRRRQNKYNFSWHDALQSHGDTLVKLQYCHCRLVNLEKECGLVPNPEATPTPSFLTDPLAALLVRELARYDEVLVETYQELEPCILVQYLFKLCHSINKAYNLLQVKSAPQDVGEARLALFMAAKHTLAAGMSVLGVVPLREM